MIVILVGVPTASAATNSTASATASLLNLPDQNDLEADLLERQLVTCATKESQSALGGFVDRAEFNADRLSFQMGEVFLHLAVEDEGDVGIEFFLELPELALPVLPGTGLEHRQHEDVLARVVGEGVEHSRALDTGAGRGRIGSGQIFAEGNHT